MGAWSWNPNEWSMTPEEALAYEQAKADAAAYETQTDPGVLDQITNAVTAAAKTTQYLMWGGLLLGAWMIFKKKR